MQRSDERQVLFLDMKIKSYSQRSGGIRPKKAEELATLLQKFHKAGSAVQKNRARTETIYISDYEIDSKTKTVKMLINRSDIKAADPAFSNPDKKTRRVVKKDTGEGHDNSAHVIWKLTHQEGEPDAYLFLLEVSPGLTSTWIQKFLNQIFSKISAKYLKDFQCPHPDGSVDKDGKRSLIRYKSKIELHGHLCENLKKEIDEGVLDGIEVYTEAFESTPWDSLKITKEKSRRIEIKVNNDGNRIRRNFELMKEVFGTAEKRQYEYARVKFKTSDNLNRSVNLYTDTASVVRDFKYIKKAKIEGFKVPLVSSYDKIYPQIIEKMENLK